MNKFYIINHSDGGCLAEFDHNKYPSTDLGNGYWSGPDAWSESPDPDYEECPALLFKTKAEAVSIKSLLENDIWSKGETYEIKKVTPYIKKTLELSEEQLHSLISVLKCVTSRASNYGSFGNGDTYYNDYAIEKVIKQLGGEV